jgi:two-component sensor histidine kinase
VANQDDQLNGVLAHFAPAPLARAVLMAAGEHLLIVGQDGRLMYCGTAVAALLGSTPQALLGRSWAQLQSPVQLLDEQPIDHLCDQLPHGSSFSCQLLHQNGMPVAVSGEVIPLATAPGSATGYIYVIRGSEPASPASLPFTDLHTQILEESNHRVRNNLAMICALLDMEMLSAPAGERQRLLISLARTRSLALVYNLVDKESGQVEISILVRAVFDSVRTLFERIDGAITITCPTPAHISARRATYLGLAVTELAIHFIQCALRNGTNPFPFIEIQRSENAASLTVTSQTCVQEHPCAGLAPLSREIVVSLVERSLRGQCEIDNDGPLRATITCPIP